MRYKEKPLRQKSRGFFTFGIVATSKRKKDFNNDQRCDRFNLFTDDVSIYRTIAKHFF